MGCRGQGLITWHKQSLSTHDSARCRRAKVQFQRQIQYNFAIVTLNNLYMFLFLFFFFVIGTEKPLWGSGQ